MKMSWSIFLQSYFLLAASLPNQPHLLKKYQINMGFSNFHEFGILSGMCILASYQIELRKNVVSTMAVLFDNTAICY